MACCAPVRTTCFTTCYDSTPYCYDSMPRYHCRRSCWDSCNPCWTPRPHYYHHVTTPLSADLAVGGVALLGFAWLCAAFGH